ncbi:arginine--tRNA ligase [Hufsiella ginkgonis]|uniref:Arginine--tRNA ligase n=1 Tax=Hufsiella ginkgonis TaxID=2695274 RepID=A0A7K1Y1P4_9SPHI|nr:arginine--tRNA ligase [Hufsiella ginkgonis]MXV16606.1 arginine--tRNA ligase [Hufsiella ginkgonis]
MNFIIEQTVSAIKTLYGVEIGESEISLQQTRREFEGQVTIVTFPFTRFSRKSPEQTGQEIGAYLLASTPEISGFNTIKGFLNLVISDRYWIGLFNDKLSRADYGQLAPNGKKVMVEYSSPNTNKPLHLGHVRNNLLGFSVAEILKAAGYEVIRTNLVNDRGIHICKSMLAWQQFGNGETPANAHIKGDHLVGKYYVRFEAEIKEQIAEIKNNLTSTSLISNETRNAVLSKESVIKKNKAIINYTVTSIAPAIRELGPDAEIRLETALDNANFKPLLDVVRKKSPDKKLIEAVSQCNESQKVISEAEEIKNELVRNGTPLMREAQQMLRKWEAGDEEVINLWKMMNDWVYAGFEETYRNLGVAFEKFYYESDTYLLGKDLIQEGLEKDVFFKKDDGSVWIDLTAEGLDQKLVLRADGTSVYITQDLGTAQLKYDDFGMDESIYVVGNEQDYHFKVLFLILSKLGKTWAKGLYHLSYGMVDLPSGKMKSREGTVVDADDLIREMTETATQYTEESGRLDGFSPEEKQELHQMIGLAALKYFLLKVEPQKRLLFDPKESVEFQGHTGPFIQYSHARIRSLVAKANYDENSGWNGYETLLPEERELILALNGYPAMLEAAAKDHSPAMVANYVYELARLYNKFYHDAPPILKTEDAASRNFRLRLSLVVGAIIKRCMGLMGIGVPERM